uniref:RING-type E3 ubiquitin transferase n=1 Tax=Caligus clemensi TaxID=344056 RepID=C1C0B4_CALCM|nr:Postreplication repair E3 ubiquitin-protein ligase RAD18 [Caligus clemensi]
METFLISPSLLESYPRLESILSCSVCYETIRDPVLTKCSHSFCSLCIRRYLLYKLQCPSCFHELHENDLIPNKPLRDILQQLAITLPKSDSSPSKDCENRGIAVLSSKFEAHSLHCSNSPSKLLKAKIALKPISKPVYHIMKDSELKKKLKEEGLCIKGDRKALIARHQKFTILWNTECSKETPLSKSEILNIVIKEEASEAKRQKDLIDSVNENNKRTPMKDTNPSQNEEPSSGSPSHMVLGSPTLVKSGELYISPKRKNPAQLLESGKKKMKQNSVRSLFEQTERRKVTCPSCNTLITASFLNIHLDRCLEVEGEMKGTRPKTRTLNSPGAERGSTSVSTPSTSGLQS